RAGLFARAGDHVGGRRCRGVGGFGGTFVLGGGPRVRRRRTSSATACSCHQLGDVLVLRRDHADHLADRRRITLGQHPGPQYAITARHELHDRLVSLDFGERLTVRDGVTLVLQPLYEAPLLHG